ncbi:MAG TPA: quinol:cytochrome C oxidoreductase [Cytophagales bacterium]|nr:quinol:cytochrome C oxidoreductase [Cytophagales bacterium]
MKVESHSIEERFEFSSKAKKTLAIIVLVGIVLFGIGCYQAANPGNHDTGHATADTHGKAEDAAKEEEGFLKPTPGHSAGEQILIEKERASWAKTEISNQIDEPKGFGAEEITTKGEAEHGAEAGHGEESSWTKRLYANLWINNVFFAGIALVGFFFYALQFAASAGWSAGLKRIPLAFGSWLSISGILMLVIFFLAQHDLFHWTHADLYDKGSSHYDEIIDGKKGYLNVPFFIIRMVLYFIVWYGFYWFMRKEAIAEDLTGDTKHYVRSKWLSAFFIIFLAITNSTSSWDWLMSIDTHWFSTMYGWFYFAALFVTSLAAITLFVVYLKEYGYLSIVNENHLHDLGKFVFAFSIFYTYIWFSQFFLIYYTNMPEETIYFLERVNNIKYGAVFYGIIFLTFVFPFLLFMTRDAKRQIAMLKIVCIIVIAGQWLNFWLMVTPGVLQENGGLGFMEFGIAMIFGGAFVAVVLASLSKLPLIAKNHPMLEESIHHHI